MPNRNAQKRRNDQVIFRSNKGKTRSGQVVKDQTAPSTAPTSSTAATGGTLAAATYSYRVTAVYGGLESAPSPAKTQTTTGTTSTVTIDWTALVPASGMQPSAFKVYGRTGGSELLMATVNMPTTTFIDTGAVTPAGALPTNTGQVLLHFGTGLPNVVATKLAATKGTTPGYIKR